MTAILSTLACIVIGSALGIAGFWIVNVRPKKHEAVARDLRHSPTLTQRHQAAASFETGDS
jgi:hypothetical protein